MNPEQQRIAIAQACGWFFMDDSWHYPNGAKALSLPDYLTDLNAMHEAAKVLKSKERMQWSDWLHKIAGYHSYDLAQATAAQRAEAFLRTLNLWKP
jgi:hypothetical protein